MNRMTECHAHIRAAEFCAGIGLVRMVIDEHGFNVVWISDIESAKDDAGLTRASKSECRKGRMDA